MNENRLPILVLEDDDLDMKCIKQAFSDEKIENETYFASEASGALNIFSRYSDARHWIILPDMWLPDISGLGIS